MEIKAGQRLEEVGPKASFMKKRRRKWGLSDTATKENWVKRFWRKTFIIKRRRKASDDGEIDVIVLCGRGMWRDDFKEGPEQASKDTSTKEDGPIVAAWV